jgi:uncharacterized protein
MEDIPSTGVFYTIRLRPHEDLRQSCIRFASQNNLQAAAIITCVGSLEHVYLRMAGKKNETVFQGKYEIVSLVGTVAADYAHLHLSMSDSEGVVTGGHLLNGSLVYTTAELVLVHFPAVTFERHPDPAYGYRELVVKALK